MADPTYRIRGIAPPDLPSERSVRLMFYSWVVEIGLRVKDRELAQGLDAKGKPLRPISPQTRKRRRSAMTPDGRGDPSAPPLMPARALSRTRSLLAGRATEDAAVFYWRFDPFTGNSWGAVLAIHRRKGRDVIGLSPKGVARVQALAWERWRAWKRGEPIAAATRSASPGIPQVGSYSTEHATFGIGAAKAPAFVPGQSTGGMTWPEWQRYLRQPSPTPVAIPGRPAAAYPRVSAHTWGTTPPGPGPRPPGPKPAPRAPRPPKPAPVAPLPPAAKARKPRPAAAAAPAKPGEFRSIDQVRDWARATFPAFKADYFDGGGVPVEAWNVIAPELDRLAGTWPGVAGRLEWLHDPGIDWADPKWDNTLALADPGSGRMMAFNPRFWADLETVRAGRREMSATGFGPKGITDPAAIARHEWGHLLEAWLRDTQRDKLETLVKVFVDKDGDFDALRAATVSQYAATSGREAFAEAFLAATSQPAEYRSPATKQFAAYLSLVKRGPS